jgi:hypothetical protein
MWKKLIQAAAITSVLYFVVGMSKSPIAQPTLQFSFSGHGQKAFAVK